MALKVGELYGVLKLDKSQFDRGLRGSGMSFGKFRRVVAAGAVVIAAALAAIGVAALKTSVDFQKGMANVQTLIGRGSEADKRIAELGDAVKDLSKETGKPLDDLTDGLYQVISAFGDSPGSIKKLDIAARAATAGLSTTKDAINLLSAVTKGYDQTTVKATQKASDLAFQTVVLGQTSFPELAASMGKTIPGASALHVKQTELFAGFAALTGVTGTTAEVSTQLAGVFTKLQKPGGELSKVYKELGVRTGAELVKKKGLLGALQAIGNARHTEKVGLAAVIGNARALNAVQSLLGAQTDDYREKLKKLRKAQGSTNEAYKIQQATVSATLSRIKASVDVLLLNLGDKLLPFFEKFLDWVLDNMPAIEDAVGGFFDFLADVVPGIIGTVAPIIMKGFEAIVSVIDGVVSAISDLTGIDKGAILAIGVAVAGALSLIAAHPVVALILGVVVALGLLKTAWDEDWGGIRTTITDLWDDTLKPFFDDLTQAFTDLADNEDVQNIADFLLTPFQVAADLLGGVVETITKVLEGDLEGAFTALIDTAVSVPQNILDGLAGLAEGLAGLAPGLLEAAGKLGGAIFDGIVKFLTGLPAEAGRIIDLAVAAIVDAWNKIDISIPPGSFEFWGASTQLAGTPLAFDVPRFALDWAGTGDLIPDVTLAKGAWKVPGPMPALLHAGEMVMPAAIANQMRDGRSSWGDMLGGGSGAPLIGEQNYYGVQPDEVERQTRRAMRRQALEWTMAGNKA